LPHPKIRLFIKQRVLKVLAIIQTEEYMFTLKRNKIDISMTEENHCYENALAERVNGILKDEFYLDQTFTNIAHQKELQKMKLIYITK
jgi:hypothetical protein